MHSSWIPCAKEQRFCWLPQRQSGVSAGSLLPKQGLAWAVWGLDQVRCTSCGRRRKAEACHQKNLDSCLSGTRINIKAVYKHLVIYLCQGLSLLCRLGAACSAHHLVIPDSLSAWPSRANFSYNVLHCHTLHAELESWAVDVPWCAQGMSCASHQPSHRGQQHIFVHAGNSPLLPCTAFRGRLLGRSCSFDLCSMCVSSTPCQQGA